MDDESIREVAASQPGDPEARQAIDGDGYVYDVATGEVLGHVDVTEDWTVDSEAKAEWVLQLLNKLEGDIAGIDARIAAVTAQLQGLRRDRERHVEWWRWRFRASLVEFARSRLTSKRRSARFGWGTVAFRKTRGAHWITDMDAAVEFARTWCPGAIKTKHTVNVTDLLEAKQTAEKDLEESVSCPFLASSEETECVSITTGINVEVRE